MTRRSIIQAFVLGMSVYVLAVFLWPSNSGPSNKTTRLAGQTHESAFLPERFGVPAPAEQITPG
ncbi:hypothetical protein LH464_16760 [Neorhizobium sp. T786]|uniref:hypothetical protein n=1 Tax=Pseudorhizobium xiangyangii TaxID=2883104 RepID=UPI001CFFB4D2|nr:hypothetical protein [Neorhizobium xiangyangii]MCB5204120.1 hypothetical protein [Neorhizobium xiangyangii]